LMSVRRKLALDLDYIEHGSLWLDARLFLCTFLRIIKIHESFLTWSLRLERDALIYEVNASADPSSDSTEATPETILLQAVQASSSNEARDEDSAIESDQMTSRKPR
jgi:hypothetical protein